MMIRPHITLITPDLAATWLAKNTRNRHLSPGLIDRYAEAMRRGEWQLNGDPIRFDEDDVLLDGQHRLAAVVKSQIPIRSLIVQGVPAIAQDTMDTGRKRTVADVLSLRDEKAPTTLAAALVILWRLETGEWAAGKVATTQQAMSMLKRHPDVRASIPLGQRVARKVPLLRAGIGTALHYHLARLDNDSAEADAKQFFEALATGVNLEQGEPALVLRTTLSRYRNDRIGLSAIRVTALTVKAWNAYREGQRISILRWAPGGARPEAFPKAR